MDVLMLYLLVLILALLPLITNPTMRLVAQIVILVIATLAFFFGGFPIINFSHIGR